MYHNTIMFGRIFQNSGFTTGLGGTQQTGQILSRLGEAVKVAKELKEGYNTLVGKSEELQDKKEAPPQPTQVIPPPQPTQPINISINTPTKMVKRRRQRKQRRVTFKKTINKRRNRRRSGRQRRRRTPRQQQQQQALTPNLYPYGTGGL